VSALDFLRRMVGAERRASSSVAAIDLVGRPTLGRSRGECECDEGHSVAKLGHSDECPWYGFAPPTFSNDHSACSLANVEHDFEWATYNGATTSTGVCRCGLQEIHYFIARAP
jgi:hypothetical protein